LESKVLYKGEDIAYIIVLKVEHTVREIAARKGLSFEDAYDIFAKSATHRALQNPDTLLWTESSEFIADEFEREALS